MPFNAVWERSGLFPAITDAAKTTVAHLFTTVQYNEKISDLSIHTMPIYYSLYYSKKNSSRDTQKKTTEDCQKTRTSQKVPEFSGNNQDNYQKKPGLYSKALR
jgi:hypothetical protein